MDIDPARHDVLAGGVDRLCTFELHANRDNASVRDTDVRLIHVVGGDDGSTFDDFVDLHEAEDKGALGCNATLC